MAFLSSFYTLDIRFSRVSTDISAYRRPQTDQHLASDVDGFALTPVL